MRLKEILESEEVEETEGDLDEIITGLAYDSRTVRQGDLFFALPGSRTDGREYASHALQRGAAAVVSERRVALPPGSTWVRVRNVRQAMGRWAALFYSYPSRKMALVGITGTNGKTTVSYLVESIFSAAGMEPGVIGTVNYRYGGRLLPASHTTPESVDLQALLAAMAEAGVGSVAMEVSSHALALERVRGLDFDVAVFTNLTRDHLDFHGDMESYFSAKASLFTDYLASSAKKKKSAVIHAGDPRGGELLDKARRAGLEVMSYGQDSRWDLHPLEVEGDIRGTRGRLAVKGEEVDFSSELIGAANLENIMAAFGVGAALGFKPGVIAEGISRLKAVPGRLEKIENSLGLSVLVDYAHTPDALERALRALRPLARKRLIALFGCGGDRDRGKRPLMGEIAARLSDLVILTSDNPRTEDPVKILEEIEQGVKRAGMARWRDSESAKGYRVEPDRRAAIGLALGMARAGDLLLIAGKGHEDYQILGSTKIHFDDREVAREALSRRAGG